MAAVNHPLGQRGRPLPIPLPSGRPNWWVLGAVVVVGFSAMLPVLQNSWTTTRGFETQDLEARQARLNSEIQQLEADVANLSSLNRIQGRAEEIGMIPGGTPIYVAVDEAGPAPANIPPELLPELARESDEPDTWWRSLMSMVPLLN